MTRGIRRLNPSDFASLWEQCRRCFYLEVVSGFPRPRAATPQIVGVIDQRMKAAFDGRRTESICPELPPGVLEHGEKIVESAPLDIQVPDGILRCDLRGALDTMIKLDDGSFAVVDFAASADGGDPLEVRARQLHAYAHALEHPAPSTFGLAPVSRLGVLVFEPCTVSSEPAGLAGGLRWIEIARDDSAFFGFLAELLTVLEQPAPPGGTPLCAWCVYRDASRRTGL